jgi:hypothetical protein
LINDLNPRAEPLQQSTQPTRHTQDDVRGKFSGGNRIPAKVYRVPKTLLCMDE